MIRFSVELLTSPAHRTKTMCISLSTLDEQLDQKVAAFECHGEQEDLEDIAEEMEVALNKLMKGLTHGR